MYDSVAEELREIKSEAYNGIIVKKEEHDDDACDRGGLLQTSSKITLRKSIEWSICLSDRVVLVRQDEERGYLYHRTLLPSNDGPITADDSISADTASWLIDYLNLKVPLAELYEEWSEKDEVFRRFAKRFTGVRMLRQDPWECLCA